MKAAEIEATTTNTINIAIRCAFSSVKMVPRARRGSYVHSKHTQPKAASLPSTTQTAAPSALIPKPWGEELILGRTAQAACKLLRIRARRRLSLQYHRCKQEMLIVRRGRITLTLGDSVDALQRRTLTRGARASVAAGVIHRIEALDADAEVLEFAFDLPDGCDDIVRLEDDYGRAGA